MRALSKNPDDRHVNARTLRTDLRGVLDASTAQPGLPSMRPKEDSQRFLDAANYSERPGPLAELEQADLETRMTNIPVVAQALQASLATGDAIAARRIVVWLEERLKDPSIEERELDAVWSAPFVASAIRSRSASSWSASSRRRRGSPRAASTTSST